MMIKLNIPKLNERYTPATIDLDLPRKLRVAGLPDTVRFTEVSRLYFQHVHVITRDVMIENLPSILSIIRKHNVKKHAIVLSIGVANQKRVYTFGYNGGELQGLSGKFLRVQTRTYLRETTDQDVLDKINLKDFVDDPETVYYVQLLYNKWDDYKFYIGHKYGLCRVCYREHQDGETVDSVLCKVRLLNIGGYHPHAVSVDPGSSSQPGN